MNILKILIIFLLIVIYSVIFWPTLTIYTHTSQNILVKINRITGESYYCTYDKWIKIKDEVAFEPVIEPIKEEIYSGGYKPIKEIPNEFVSYEDSINQQTEDNSP